VQLPDDGCQRRLPRKDGASLPAKLGFDLIGLSEATMTTIAWRGGGNGEVDAVLSEAKAKGGT